MFDERKEAERGLLHPLEHDGGSVTVSDDGFHEPAELTGRVDDESLRDEQRAIALGGDPHGLDGVVEAIDVARCARRVEDGVERGSVSQVGLAVVDSALR